MNSHLPTAQAANEIRTGRLVKPDTVGRWINYWSRDDCISNTVQPADENDERDFLPGASLCSSLLFDQYAYIIAGAHNKYTTDASTVADIADDIAGNLIVPDCANLLVAGRPIPEGFGAAYNVFAPGELILRASCEGNQATLTAGNGTDTQRVYKDGYFWTGTVWRPLSFTGTRREGDYIIGRASAALAFDLQHKEDRSFLASICIWSSSQWKCGCRDRACEISYWQLQTFRPR